MGLKAVPETLPVPIKAADDAPNSMLWRRL